MFGQLVPVLGAHLLGVVVSQGAAGSAGRPVEGSALVDGGARQAKR
jgi:hypothetical protein